MRWLRTDKEREAIKNSEIDLLRDANLTNILQDNKM